MLAASAIFWVVHATTVHVKVVHEVWGIRLNRFPLCFTKSLDVQNDLKEVEHCQRSFLPLGSLPVGNAALILHREMVHPHVGQIIDTCRGTHGTRGVRKISVAMDVWDQSGPQLLEVSIFSWQELQKGEFNVILYFAFSGTWSWMNPIFYLSILFWTPCSQSWLVRSVESGVPSPSSEAQSVEDCWRDFVGDDEFAVPTSISIQQRGAICQSTHSDLNLSLHPYIAKSYRHGRPAARTALGQEGMQGLEAVFACPRLAELQPL